MNTRAAIPSPDASDERVELWQRRWIRWPVYGVLAWLVLCGVLAAGLPFAVERFGVPKASEMLGRPVRVGKTQFNPFTLRLLARDLRVGGPTQGRTAGEADSLSVERIEIDLSARSLRLLAPVIETLRISAPSLRIARDREGRFDFEDIVERIRTGSSGPQKPADDAPARFVLNGVELNDGRIALDDHLFDQQHEVADLDLVLPRLSSFAEDREKDVEPTLSARVDGAPLSVTGSSLPFHPSRRSTFQLKLSELDIGRYLKWSPVPLNFSSPGGRLSTELRVAYAHENDRDRLGLDGPVRIEGLVVDTQRGARLLSMRHLEAKLAGLEPLENRYAIEAVSIDGLDVDLVREANGQLPLVAALTPGEPHEARKSPKSSGKAGALTWSIGATSVKNSRAVWHDRAVSPQVRLEQSDIAIDLGAIGNRQAEAAPARISMKHGAEGHVSWHGKLDLAKSHASGRVEARAPTLGHYRPYFAGHVAGTVDSGRIDAAASVSADWSRSFSLALHDSRASVDAVQIALASDNGKEPSFRFGRIAVEGVDLGLVERKLNIARATLARSDLRVVREKNGELNLARILKSSASPKAAQGPESPAWTVELARVDLDDNRVDWLDRSTPSPVQLPLTGLSGTVSTLGTRLDQRSAADLRMKVARDGELALNGQVIGDPLGVDMALRWKGLPLGRIDPYLARSQALALQAGVAGGTGRLRFGSNRARFSGDLEIRALKASERRNDSELVRWKTLSLTKVDADLAVPASGAKDDAPLADGGNPADRVSIGAIALDGLFARVELSPEGRLNLSELLKSASGNGDGKEEGKREGKGNDSSRRMQIRVGGVRIQDGAADFTDHFIKPNYHANLSELGGTIGAIATGQNEPSDVDIAGTINGEAPVSISGRINPLGDPLYTDIHAVAKDLDLPMFSPYSAKYAGYTIEKGKLVLDVRYLIENGQLKAANRIVLDQLTFGEKSDSPDATKVPVQFAIGLLKNRKGEIDLDLPVSGSLDDPQFSLSSVLWNAFTNLLSRVVTAPFAALSSVFGGGKGEDLSHVQFEPGTSQLKVDSVKRLTTLANAFSERPALTLEITGRMDPKAEAQAFGRARLEARLRALQADGDNGDTKREALLAKLAQSLKVPVETPSQTASSNTVPARVASATEGSAASVSSAALERRLATLLGADADAQRELAAARGRVARDWLVRQGKVDRERIYLLAPKVQSIDAKGGADDGRQREAECTRDCAEFSLRR